MHSQLGPERAKLRVSGQNVRMGAACFPVLGVKSAVAKLWELRMAGVLAYRWNAWPAVEGWYGTGQRPQVCSATGA